MSTIEVVFDGKAFVPVVPVDLPTGTKASLVVTGRDQPSPGKPPRAPTAEEHEQWAAIVAAIRSVPPDPPTVEEAMREIRGRP